ncbi:hypothetical protein NEOKW01_1975 [Nematocida sp. AWRm80]|nr:hypothetical protein NEOKW01_1975 [Nematocida sp. AWRm80]
MASIVYKCTRRIVNLIAFLLIVDTVLLVIYIYCTKSMERIETSLLYTMGMGSYLMNYLVSASIFMAMVSSTSVNSKSKFTLKIAIAFGLLYFVFTGAALLYLRLSYRNKLSDAIYQQNYEPGRNERLIALAGELVSDIPGNIIDLEQARQTIKQIMDKELRIIVGFFLFSFTAGGLATLLMLLSVNCQIKRRKDLDSLREVETYTQAVGVNTPFSSLRPKKGLSSSAV